MIKTHNFVIKIQITYHIAINVSTLKEKVLMSSKKIEKPIFKWLYKVIKLSIKTEKTDLKERQKLSSFTAPYLHVNASKR